MTLSALIYTDDESGFRAEVPAIPGCITQGETIDEVRENLDEAVHAWIGDAEYSDAEIEAVLV
jgi:predicted RNase H-like HicB family nuclease